MLTGIDKSAISVIVNNLYDEDQHILKRCSEIDENKIAKILKAKAQFRLLCKFFADEM